MRQPKVWYDIQQNTDEWLDLRIGKLTGSGVKNIMANYGKVFGEPAKKLAVTIAREQLTGKRSLNESYSNAHMERGHEQEPIARALYEELFFTDVTNGGFYGVGALGCSPDGLVCDNGLIEIKSVIDHVQYATIKRGGFDPSYKWQLYFNLMQSGREWIDYVSYCADFPPATRLHVHRIYKAGCTECFEMMNARIKEFFTLVGGCKEIIKG